MFGKLDKLCNIIDRIIGYVVSVLFVVMSVSCVLQVLTRYVLNSSLTWTEELARFTFIWGNMLGATICTRRHGHAVITVILDLFPKLARRIIDLLILLCMLLASAVLVIYGVDICSRTTKQYSASMGIPMCYIYAAAVVGGAIIFVYCTDELLMHCSALSKKEGEA
jgi:TRAP-type C4-dicarboxylate transport system permease small subunit